MGFILILISKTAIVLLVLFAMAVLGGIANGTFADLGNQNIGYYIGFFGGLGALLVLGILNLKGKK